MASNGHQTQRCWVTLLTSPSYLPGVITLAFSLSVQKSKYPLVVLVTPSVPSSSLRALKLESAQNPLITVRHVESLMPSNGQETTGVAKRFEDTWTKLRAFELTTYEACVFLDADITIYKNIDHLFETRLPGRAWIAACPVCVCNLDKDEWAPDNWKRENCAFTPLRHPSALKQTLPTPQHDDPPHPHALLNGGVFLYHPSPTLWHRIIHYFNTCPDLHNFQFPDQDFLAAFFVHKWVPLSWQFNALKTMRQWHPNIWRDSEVRALHYIVDKPWQRRIASDGIAGYLGRDGETHSWWWNIYQRWMSARLELENSNAIAVSGSTADVAELLKLVSELVAPKLVQGEDAQQCNENASKGFPVPLPTDQD